MLLNEVLCQCVMYRCIDAIANAVQIRLCVQLTERVRISAVLQTKAVIIFIAIFLTVFIRLAG